MDKLDLIFRPASVADCYILNDWLRLEGWIFRTEEEVRQDPYGRMKFGVNLAAEDTKTNTLLGIASYRLPRPNYAYFSIYIVHPDYRGLGIGKLLWNRAFEEIGDKNVGIHSANEMTTKYRNKSGFKVVGNTSLRYLIPKEELITQLKFQISAGNRSVVFSHVTTSDDKEKLVKFIQSAEGRTERYAEDDFVLGGIDMPNQHTISASDLSGKTLGWATIKFGGDMEDRITPLYAIDDEICLLLMADLLEKFGSKMSDKVMVTVSALKEFVVTFIRTVPNVKLIRTQEMSFTKYNEYLPEKIKYLYFSQMF